MSPKPDLQKILFQRYVFGTASGLQQIDSVTAKMLIGTGKSPCLDAKAMESKTLFMFLVWLLRKVLPRLRCDAHSTAPGLLTASQSLEEWYKILRASGPLPEPIACNHAVVLAKKTCHFVAAPFRATAQTKTSRIRGLVPGNGPDRESQGIFHVSRRNGQFDDLEDG
jgi:hypothetical protein